MDPNKLTPLYRQALRTMGIGTPAVSTLVRCKGGYRRKDGGGPVFTTRTVNAMAREWLVEMDAQFPPAATLTPKGAALAEQLVGVDDKAGAA